MKHSDFISRFSRLLPLTQQPNEVGNEACMLSLLQLVGIQCDNYVAAQVGKTRIYLGKVLESVP
jgi:hypothetical protein